MAGLFVFDGRPVTPPVVGALLTGAPAQEAGILPGDRIVSMNGERMERFEDVARFVMVNLDQPMRIVVQRGEGQAIIENVRSRKEMLTDRFGFTQTRATLGIISTGVALDPKMVASVDNTPVAEGALLERLIARKGEAVKIGFKPDMATGALRGYTIVLPKQRHSHRSGWQPRSAATRPGNYPLRSDHRHRQGLRRNLEHNRLYSQKRWVK